MLQATPPFSPAALARLGQLLASRLQQPFAWGRSDCWLLAADAAHALTGRDPAADLRGHYSSAWQAIRTLQREGGTRRLVARRVGPRVAVAVDGAVAMLNPARTAAEPVGEGPLGVVWRGQVLAQGAVGLVAVPLADALAFWLPQADDPMRTVQP